MKNTLRVTFVTLLTPLLIACGGGGGSGCSAVLGLLPGAGCSTPNTAPEASAGVTQNVTTGSLVTLDGSGSRDANNHSLTYLWQMTAVPAGSLAALSSNTSAKPTFTADVTGNYTVSLVVNDGKTSSTSSVVSIYASTNNLPPSAVAGPNQNVSIGTSVTLDGTSSFDNNREDTLTYKWVLVSIPTNSKAKLSSSFSPNPKFTADVEGTYSAILTVNDGKVDSTASVVTITASVIKANTKPYAVAGAPQNVSLKVEPIIVTLDGSMSRDDDKDLIKYQWRLITVPKNSKAALQKDTTPVPYFSPDLAGTYVASLIVYDGKEYSEPDATTVTVSAKNSAPIARAGASQNMKLGSVTLDGTNSSDDDGDPIGFMWTMVAKPALSNASLKDPTSPKPTFTADAPGIYVFNLIVRDIKGAASELNPTSPLSTTTVTASLENRPPQAVTELKRPNEYVGPITLDGSKSFDPDLGDTLTYVWTMVSRPDKSNATIANGALALTNFIADIPGTYVISFVVIDDKKNISETKIVTITASNSPKAPNADAGVSKPAFTGDLVELDGTKSSDPNPEDTLKFDWVLVSKPAGSSATLDNATIAKPKFRADVSGVYLFSLVVNDGKLYSPVATTTVTATTANRAPIANPGPVQSVSLGQVTLDGSASSDPDGDILKYSWTLLAKPIGSSATLNDSANIKPTFTADLSGVYVASLVVTDPSKANSDPKTVLVTASIANREPVASAATYQNVVTGQQVTVDGSGSTDADGDILTYTWKLLSAPLDSTATLVTTTPAKRTFTADKKGTYVLSLQVHDGKVPSLNNVIVTVNAGDANVAPVANAGVAQTVARNATVKLDATASSDANGDILIYRWVLTYRPTNSTAVLSSATAREPTFTADQAGVYVATLVVSDGRLDSTQVTIAITATP